jgi:hypothetical protein
MGRYFGLGLLIFALFILYSCVNEDWEDHYSSYNEKINMKLWDAIREEPRFTKFVEYIKEYDLDTFLCAGHTYTLFIPDNDAFDTFVEIEGFVDKILSHHISPTVFLTRNIQQSKKLLTLSGKYALLERNSTGYTFAGVNIDYESPLYLDGVFYEISEVAYPRPNLYEFTALYSSIIKNYIDLNDSVYLNKDKSKPIGFDINGNTIYDSVFSTVNLFERDFFPVKKEFRDKSATFVLFTQEQYEEALDEMAVNLGGVYNSHLDIPSSWQFEILLPEVLKNALFDGMLSYQDFLKDTLRSITGDTVIINHEDIDPLSRFLCSNGIVFTYSDFYVPDSLYKGEIRVEGESLIDSIGAGVFAWKDEVLVTGQTLASWSSSDAFSNGYLLNVPFPRNYTGEFSLQFLIKNVFPSRYRLVWSASYRPSGLFAVYVNGDKIAQYDNYNLRSTVISVTGERFLPVNGLNKKDFWVDNIDSYGDVIVRFEYLGSGLASNNGFNMDYLALIPAAE